MGEIILNIYFAYTVQNLLNTGISDLTTYLSKIA